MGISLCMIVKPGEKRLDYCLRNVKDIADQIIIVINKGKEDITKEIAKKHGADVYEFEWCDDFSKARNFSISKATQDWILILDADERISEKSKRIIKDAVKNDKNDIFSMTKKNLLLTKGLHAKKVIRKYCKDSHTYNLFRNLPDIRYIFRVHETLNQEAIRKYREEKLPVIIYNIRNKKDPPRASYYRMLIEKDLEDGYINKGVLFNLIEASIANKEWEKIDKYIESLKKLSKDELITFKGLCDQIEDEKTKKNLKNILQKN